MILLFQVAVILVLARLARRIVVPLGQPAVIGEMVAGLMLGPSCFGWLMPDSSAALFASATLPPLDALSQLGLVLFMFLVGVRLDAHAIGERRNVAIVTSVTSIVVPFTLGAGLASMLHAQLAPGSVSVVPFALFVGAAMSITAFPVLARILIDQRLLGSRLGVMAITCAAFDDVTGWLILAAITTIVRAEGVAGVMALRLVLFAAYVAAMLFVVRPALGWFAKRRGLDFGKAADDLAVVLLLTLGSAIATESLGVHALFGAFFAGLIVPRESHVERLFTERVEPLTMTLLLPLFFAFTGLRTNVQLIDSPAMWRDAALILAAAVLGKAGASTVAARVMGVEWREASILGILLNTRGLIELVVLNIGLDLGILSPRVFSMLVLMALATTLMTSPIVAWLRRERRIAVPNLAPAYHEARKP